MSANPPLTGPQKAALVLLSLDQAVAADVLRHLGERDIKRLAESAESLSPAQTRALDVALEEFSHKMSEVVLAHDAGSYLKQLTVGALGAERADQLFSPPAANAQPLETIRAARPQTLAELLNEENPQLAAVIVSQLPRSQAVKVLGAMAPERQSDLLGRIARLESLPAAMVQMASAALAEALNTAGNLGGGEEERDFDGVAFAAGMLNELPPGDSERLLGALSSGDADLAPRVREAMFTFEDLIRVDTRALQTLMREVQSERLLVALKTATEELREHFLSAVSSRAAATLREDLAIMPPTRLSDVEAAQREIVETATRMAAEKRLVLPTSGQEKLV